MNPLLSLSVTMETIPENTQQLLYASCAFTIRVPSSPNKHGSICLDAADETKCVVHKNGYLEDGNIKLCVEGRKAESILF